ncbi:YicC/YloC family endoribonuclease [Cohaesibacter celericrescens]|uniref:YicC family protein n=1 Tax=Cohaesibacter celericrescens TaxID=2067669 RepID=A0A2N5XSC1_9HYPH|nr:YicC/YloC family endoribonuclease [Cohaesibacter celericrescens]PLW77394.1 YicC family protein [Cohaesibacter celericrescens]
MTLVSMTGFTRANGTYETYRWTWEIKTVNGKGLDLRFRLPPGYDELDRPVRALMSERLSRGSCFVNLTVQQDANTHTLRVNEHVLDAVLSAMAMVEGRLDVKKPSLDGLLSIKGVMEPVEQEESEDVRRGLLKAIQDNFKEAVSDLEVMRSKEGAALEKIVLQRVSELEMLTRQAEECPARSADAIQAKLRQQIERILENDKGFDEDRLYQEAVLLAGKADIREELDRLYAHCAAVRTLLVDDKPVGRKLDFLSQEFNREANTLCAKSNDTSLTAIGLELKAAIEQLREQIQNVE